MSNEELAGQADELVANVSDAETRNRVLREAGLLGVSGAEHQRTEGSGPEALINKGIVGNDSE